MITFGLDSPTSEFLRPVDGEAVLELFYRAAERSYSFSDRSNAIAFLDAQFPGVAHFNSAFDLRGGHRKDRNLVDDVRNNRARKNRRGSFASKRTARHHQIADWFAVSRAKISFLNSRAQARQNFDECCASWIDVDALNQQFRIGQNTSSRQKKRRRRNITRHVVINRIQ